MSGADLVRVTAQGQPLNLGEKTVSDLIADDVKIVWSNKVGSVEGELKHVEGWTEFNPAVPDEQSGNFFPVTLSAAYRGKAITVQRVGGEPKTAVDRNWVLRIPDAQTVFTFSDENGVIFSLKFDAATLDGETA